MKRRQTLVGAGTLLIGGVFAIGAAQTRSEAGYSGVGPNFLPWVVAIALIACGIGLVAHAVRGGFRDMEPPSGADHGHWSGFVWVTAALLLNAALITTIGFIFSCTLCFVLAAHGFKSAEGRASFSVRETLTDAAIGFAIAAPVYWMFSQLLAINLPGLTDTGWL
ncbi:MAG: tripartite tricarboxylate transporter TctB family protein [Burkholderiaceae bacterium]